MQHSVLFCHLVLSCHGQLGAVCCLYDQTAHVLSLQLPRLGTNARGLHSDKEVACKDLHRQHHHHKRGIHVAQAVQEPNLQAYTKQLSRALQPWALIEQLSLWQ